MDSIKIKYILKAAWNFVKEWRFKTRLIRSLSIFLTTEIGLIGGVNFLICLHRTPEGFAITNFSIDCGGQGWITVFIALFGLLGYCAYLFFQDRDAIRMEAKNQQEKDVVSKIYIGTLDRIVKDLDVPNFHDWAYGLAVQGETEMLVRRYDVLFQLAQWLPNSRRGEILRLNNLLDNMGSILSDLLRVFMSHARVYGSGNIYRFSHYYNETNDYPLQDELCKEYTCYVILIADLTFELTRLCNLLFTEIRKYEYDFLKGYERLYILDVRDVDGHKSPIEYKENELLEFPYPGLTQFLVDRVKRKHHYSKAEYIDRDAKILTEAFKKDWII